MVEGGAGRMKLTLNHLTKSYDGGKSFALNDFTKTFEPGVYGLLGPNGAGKSTLINLITQNLKADKGEILWEGKDVKTLGKDYRSLIGFMPQQQNLYDNFTGEEFLWYMASLKGLGKKEATQTIRRMFDTVNLTAAKFKRIQAYSGGMKQRLLIAQALLNNPSILIMDEPTAGLDPKERIRIRSFISEMASGKIVILATHVISDIEFIAKEILLVREGRLIREGEPKELLKDLEGQVWDIYMDEAEWEQCQKLGVKITNLTYAGEKICGRIISETRPGIGIAKEAQPTLEDVYLYHEN